MPGAGLDRKPPAFPVQLGSQGHTVQPGHWLRWGLVDVFPRRPLTVILLISASWGAVITSLSRPHPAVFFFCPVDILSLQHRWLQRLSFIELPGHFCQSSAWCVCAVCLSPPFCPATHVTPSPSATPWFRGWTGSLKLGSTCFSQLIFLFKIGSGILVPLSFCTNFIVIFSWNFDRSCVTPVHQSGEICDLCYVESYTPRTLYFLIYLDLWSLS
jgi:hypothetical protein